ncbi:YeiH family protein [Methylobacterium nigriterrae]|uniref:YeiH family protein n=1 Tax=Methylobacterium nigriterrae TaxID=3127512 RepID=UPI00301407E1
MPVATAPSTPPRTYRVTSTAVANWLRRILPGLVLCLVVTGAAVALEHVEVELFGRAWLEGLVLAILIGTAVRTAWTPSERWRAGIAFSAKTLLEIAVVLLGASLSVATILAAGPGLLVGIAAVVAVAIAVSYSLGRALGLPRRMAVLVACGNSICGNSAIAAVAPVIGADGGDVAASIAFTAVLGVLVVLGLPLLVPLLHLSHMQYGVLAGLTVYAVPQVLAATLPAGLVATQIGTLVKLVRVLMLGPVVLVLSMLASRLREETDGPAPRVTAGGRPARGRVAIHHLVPWFILAFLTMAALRSLGLIPQVALGPIATVATLLTIVSMAALGLGVDVRVVARAGGRVTAAVTLSLIALGGVSFGLIHLLGIA